MCCYIPLGYCKVFTSLVCSIFRKKKGKIVIKTRRSKKRKRKGKKKPKVEYADPINSIYYESVLVSS